MYAINDEHVVMNHSPVTMTTVNIRLETVQTNIKDTSYILLTLFNKDLALGLGTFLNLQTQNMHLEIFV